MSLLSSLPSINMSTDTIVHPGRVLITACIDPRFSAISWKTPRRDSRQSRILLGLQAHVDHEHVIPPISSRAQGVLRDLIVTFAPSRPENNMHSRHKGGACLDDIKQNSAAQVRDPYSKGFFDVKCSGHSATLAAIRFVHHLAAKFFARHVNFSMTRRIVRRRVVAMGLNRCRSLNLAFAARTSKPIGSMTYPRGASDRSPRALRAPRRVSSCTNGWISAPPLAAERHKSFRCSARAPCEYQPHGGRVEAPVGVDARAPNDEHRRVEPPRRSPRTRRLPVARVHRRCDAGGRRCRGDSAASKSSPVEHILAATVVTAAVHATRTIPPIARPPPPDRSCSHASRSTIARKRSVAKNETRYRRLPHAAVTEEKRHAVRHVHRGERGGDHFDDDRSRRAQSTGERAGG